MSALSIAVSFLLGPLQVKAIYVHVLGGSMSVKAVEVFGLKWLNLTPHDINVYTSDNKLYFTVPRSGLVARLEEETEHVGQFVGVPVVRKRYKGVSVNGRSIEDVIEEVKPDMVIVSVLCLPALPMKIGTAFIVAPDTGPDSAVRNEKGQIVGVKRFMVRA